MEMPNKAPKKETAGDILAAWVAATSDNKASQKDETISALETEVSEVKERLKEERFYWLLALVIVIDMFVFTHMNNWGAPVSILFLQLLGLLAAAHKCGVDIVYSTIEKIIESYKRN